MTKLITDELNKLKLAKNLLRKAIQRKETGLTTSQIFSTYPTYIENMHSGTKSIDSTGLDIYAQDGNSTITITVDKLRDFAFANYSCLRSLVIDNEKVVQLDGTHTFQNTPIEKGTGFIYVPASLVTAYKNSTNWKKYANQIKSGSAPAPTFTNIIEHEHVRNVSWVESKTIEDLTTRR